MAATLKTWKRRERAAWMVVAVLAALFAASTMCQLRVGWMPKRVVLVVSGGAAHVLVFDQATPPTATGWDVSAGGKGLAWWPRASRSTGWSPALYAQYIVLPWWPVPAAAVAWAMWCRRTAGRVTGAECSRCGYARQGLADGAPCPECGGEPLV